MADNIEYRKVTWIEGICKELKALKLSHQTKTQMGLLDRMLRFKLMDEADYTKELAKIAKEFGYDVEDKVWPK